MHFHTKRLSFCQTAYVVLMSIILNAKNEPFQTQSNNESENSESENSESENSESEDSESENSEQESWQSVNEKQRIRTQ